MSLQQLLSARVLHNSVEDWLYALAAFLVTLVVLPTVLGIVRSRQKKWLAAGHAHVPVVLDLVALLVRRTSRLLLWAVALYFALSVLVLPRRLAHVLDIAIIVVFWTQAAIWGMAAARFGIERRRQRIGGPDPHLAGSFAVIMFMVNLAVWAIAVLAALANLGVQILPLLAGLGIGGIAIALAVQTILGDLLASISIALDKPFSIGDALQVDGFNGTVEHIGVKSTRLRSTTGEQIIMSNAELLKSRLRNFGRMNERRVTFQVGVTYATTLENLRAIPQEIRSIVAAHERARFDRCHLMGFGESALQFEISYVVLAPDYATHVELQQAINLAIIERFGELGVEFAYPTRTVMVETTPGAAAAPARS